MTEKMSLVVFAETGHVLGAVTRASDPEAALELKPEELVGDGLLVRDPVSGQTRVSVGPEHLAVKSVLLSEEVVLAPQQFVLANGSPQAHPNSDLSAGNPNPATIDGTNLKVELPVNVPEDVDTWVIVQGHTDSDLITREVTIPKDQKEGSVLLTLRWGSYYVLALVPGYRPFVSEELLVS